MIGTRGRDVTLSSVLIEAGVLITGTVTVDLVDTFYGTTVLAGQTMALIAGTAIYTYDVDPDDLKDDFYTAIYYYDGVPKLTENLQMVNDRERANELAGIINDTGTMAGVIDT